ncbi:MAG TPA: HAD family hydrolase [Bacillota bacterium]|nr:HAD family hydrolase [Bacillota bacterium]
MNKNYQYILFDLDGTLTDPKEGITKSVQFALAKLGIDEPDCDNLVKFIGPPLAHSFIEYYGFDEAKAKLAVEKYREYFAVTGIFENEVYPGIKTMLESLQKAGKSICLATSKPTVFAEKILEHFGLAEYFNAVAGSNLDGSRVRKSEVIQFVLESMKVGDRSKAVMIGDREHDIIGAREAGIDSIGVTFGYGRREELVGAKATAIADNPKELLGLLV